VFICVNLWLKTILLTPGELFVPLRFSPKVKIDLIRVYLCKSVAKNNPSRPLRFQRSKRNRRHRQRTKTAIAVFHGIDHLMKGLRNKSRHRILILRQVLIIANDNQRGRCP